MCPCSERSLLSSLAVARQLQWAELQLPHPHGEESSPCSMKNACQHLADPRLLVSSTHSCTRMLMLSMTSHRVAMPSDTTQSLAGSAHKAGMQQLDLELQ